MARDLNKVMLTGRLGKDVDLRVTPNGNPVATFSVASGRNVKDGDSWKEQTEWFRVVAWEKLAETCANYLKKGSHVFIEGRLQTREWQDKDGQKRTSTEVIATDMYMLDSKRSQEEGSSGGYQSNTAPSRNKPAPRRNDNPFDDEAEPEDIPF
ncbi:MAG: single-stranded DNA-binding protein [Chloroflexi bacterium]|nr:single-stranded DNA-binding protein [Chloroflexota bacterium]